jgi:hypothetical protein
MDRNARIVRNERLLRETNWETADDALHSDGLPPSDAEELVFLCACGRPDCGRELLLTLGEYRLVHDHPHRFVVAPGHVTERVERVVEERPGYWIVEKLPAYRE